MEIHKPKPWSGLREFLKEYGIIVLGVLTALGAEQFAASLDWRAKLKETREALSDELAEDLAKSQVRVELAPCVDRRLDDLAAIVDKATSTGRLPALPKPRQPPFNSWATGVWESALAAQTASHMPPDELRSYARFYQSIERIAAAGPQEEAVWTTLFGLAGPGRPFEAADARAFREAIARARTLNGITAGFGVRAQQLVDGHRLRVNTEMYRQRMATLKGFQCQTFDGPAPASYGASPFAQFPTYAREHPVH